MGTKKPTRDIKVRVTEDQYGLAARRLFTEDITWQQLLRALLNAYILGDISVSKDGRYVIGPPQSGIPVIEVPYGPDANLVEIEPDWGISNDRPQKGRRRPQSRDKLSTVDDRWGTRELNQYLREETGRRLSYPSLRLLLIELAIPKRNGTRWKFNGPEDAQVHKILEAINNGTYDAINKKQIAKAVHHRTKDEEEKLEFLEATQLSEQEKRIKYLKELREISNEEE